MKNSARTTVLHMTPIAAAVIWATAAWGAPPSTSAYATDVANEYVQDATSDGMANLNMVLCIMDGMATGDMLTQKGVLDTTTGITSVRYVALVDKNKCDSRSRSDASNSTGGATGATATPNYMNAIVDVSRGANVTDPMVGKIWMTMTEPGKQTTAISVKLSATTDPVTLPPYGKLRLDYAGYAPSAPGGAAQLQFNGFIDTNGAAVSYVETGANSSNVKLNLNAANVNNGNGVIQKIEDTGGGPVTVTYNFAYSPPYFARNDGTGDLCFDRAKANARKSVWSYGLYDATAGTRIDQLHPGFPIKGVTGSGLNGVSAGQPEFGFAGYWGINFGGIDQSLIAALPDGEVTAVTGITDQRPNNSTAYRWYKQSGKLTKWSQVATTLGALDGIPFTFFGEGCRLANGGNIPTNGALPAPDGTPCSLSTTDFQNWVMQWNSSLTLDRGTPTVPNVITGNFQVVGMQSCQPGSGCVTSNFANPTTVVQGFRNAPINGWSDALGSLTIPLPANNTASSALNFHSSTDPAYYFTQSTVLPTSANALTLYCLSNCPTAASLLSFAASPSGTPFAAPTDTQWGGTGSVELTYTFDAAGLRDAANAAVVLATAVANPMFQGGVNTGRMYATDLNTGCQAGTAYCEPAGAAEYYTYQTGPNQWNQTMWLTAAGSAVPFDPPQNISYTVPAGSAYGTWAGKAIQLQFNGFGNLGGIPGNCVDPATNTAANCGPATRYVPAFAIPDGTQLQLSGTGAVLTKALNAELRLAKVDCVTTGLSTSGVNVSLSGLGTPNNPAQSGDPAYIGSAPTVTSPPAVIDGVIQ